MSINQPRCANGRFDFKPRSASNAEELGGIEDPAQPVSLEEVRRDLESVSEEVHERSMGAWAAHVHERLPEVVSFRLEVDGDGLVGLAPDGYQGPEESRAALESILTAVDADQVDPEDTVVVSERARPIRTAQDQREVASLVARRARLALLDARMTAGRLADEVRTRTDQEVLAVWGQDRAELFTGMGQDVHGLYDVADEMRFGDVQLFNSAMTEGWGADDVDPRLGLYDGGET